MWWIDDRYLIGVHIEGICGLNLNFASGTSADDAQSRASDGNIFTFARYPKDTGMDRDLLDGFSAVPDLIDLPDAIDESVDLKSGRYDTSSIRVQVADTDRAAAGLVARAGISAVARFASSATASGSIELDTSGLAGTYIYAGGETIFLTAESGSGSYTYTTKRGQGLSTAQAHAAGALAFAKPQTLEDRVLRIYTHDRDADKWVEFQSYLVDSVDHMAGQGVIRIDASSVHQRIFGTRGATRRTTWSKSEGSTTIRAADNDGFRGHEFAIRRGAADDDRVYVTYDEPEELGENIVQVGELRSGDIHLDLTLGPPGADQSTGIFYGVDEIKEVLAFPFQLPGYPESDTSSHVVDAILTLLLSDGTGDNHADYDYLSASWALGMPASLVDVASFLEVKARTPEATIDRLILAAGDDFDIERAILDMMRAHDMFFGSTRTNKLALRLDQPATIEDVESALAAGQQSMLVPDELNYKGSRGGTRQITAVVGERPWTDGAKAYAPVPGLGISVRGIDQGEDRNLVFAHWNASRVEAVEAMLEQRANRLAFGRPVLSSKFVDEHGVTFDGIVGGAVPGVGELMIMRRGPVRGARARDGSRIDPSGKVSHVGKIVSRRIDFKQKIVSVEVELGQMRSETLARKVAPAMRVQSIGVSDELVGYGDFPDADGNTGFRVGDLVMYETATGRAHRFSGVHTITDVDDGAYHILTDSEDREAEMVVRLVAFADWTVDDGDILEVDGRPWAFISNASGVFSDGTDGDIYGR